MKIKTLFIHLGLFILTFITTLFAGVEWTAGQSKTYEFSQLILNGLPYSASVLFFLSVHEFGHYFAAKFHKVKTTLPFYIPFPPMLGFLNFGTMGAVIKTKSTIQNNKAMFDIGAAGPIAGFVASLIILIYGFTHLPGIDYLLAIHPDYFDPKYGENVISLKFGNTLMFSFLKNVFANPNDFVPPMSEVYHYPYLCVGWFGLFVTAMNMIPVGQLDGGHVVYSMFGEKKHEAIASISLIILIVLGVSSYIFEFINSGIDFGWSGWLIWSAVLYFFIKIKHPPVEEFEKLNLTRMVLGYISLLILILSFAPSPFIISSQL
jgi:membrane-associated protease RseP (regulator of RpoE activity)